MQYSQLVPSNLLRLFDYSYLCPPKSTENITMKTGFSKIPKACLCVTNVLRQM